MILEQALMQQRLCDQRVGYLCLLGQSFNNQYIITWMIHQIFMYSDKVKLTAGYNNNIPHPPPLSHPLPFNWMN